MHATGVAEAEAQEYPAGHVEQAVDPDPEYCYAKVPSQAIGAAVVVGQ